MLIRKQQELQIIPRLRHRKGGVMQHFELDFTQVSFTVNILTRTI